MINLPRKEYTGEIKAPSSKSDGHRALIAASLVKEGISKIFVKLAALCFSKRPWIKWISESTKNGIEAIKKFIKPPKLKKDFKITFRN